MGVPLTPAPSAQPNQPTGAASLGRLLVTLRRRWLILLAVWLPVAGLLVPAVWMTQKPTYTASAQIQVLPFLTRVLYKDEDNQQMPLFDSYLRTQGELIASNPVLTAALAQESIKSMPVLKEPDPLAALRHDLKAGTVPGTQIVQISVTRQGPAEAVALVKAVTGSYLDRIEETEKKGDREKRAVLEAEQKRLREAVKRNRDERLRLANQDGAATDTTFDMLQQSISESGLETKKNLETVELEILQITDQIKQIEQGIYTGLMPDESIARDQESVENDPMVRSLKEQLLAESAKLTRLKANFMPESREIARSNETIEQLTKDLDKQRLIAAENLQKDRAAAQARLKDSIISRKKTQLAAAERRRDTLKGRVTEQEEARKKIGLRSVEINTLQEDFGRLNRDLELVEERIKQLDMESQRPGRISKASDAEILPNGVSDKRLKLSMVVAIGSLCFAMAVALIRDRVDARVRVPEEVEMGMGLRMLGVVPPVEELTSGRVTQEDFAECYRLVRVNLLSAGAGSPSPKTVLVTSAQSGEGKTSLAVSLAASLAELGGRVLLVDGDIQYPRIGEVLTLTGPRSLKDVLSGERELADCTMASRLSGLHVLIARLNGDSARGLLDNQSAARLVKQAAGRYDHVIIDSPPALGAADALVWAQAADGVVLSTFAGQSSIKATQMACQRLKMVGSKLLGAVICNLSTSAGFYSYSSSSAWSGSTRPSDDARSPGETGSTRRAKPPVVQLPLGLDKPSEQGVKPDRKA